MSYRVVFQSRDFARISQPGVKLTVERMRWTCFGGCERAVLRAEGNKESLEDLKNWLRYPVTIFNKQDVPVWWGFLHSVEATRKESLVKETMEGMANRVAVFHTSLAPLDQPKESNLTAWAEDTTSQNHYGVIEKIIRRQYIDERFAVQLRDISLNEMKEPQVILEPLKEGNGTAELELCGWISTLYWKTYQNTGGMIANTVSQDGTQSVGDSTTRLRAGQSFLTTTAVNVNTVDLRLRRQGSPTDNASLSIQTDSGGLPSGTALGTVVVSGGTLEHESFPWVRFTFSTAVALSAGTTYWLVLTRSGSVSSTNYYVIGVDTKLTYRDGIFRIYDSGTSAWILRSPTADLVFRLIGTSETTQQLTDVYTVGNQFFTGLDLRVSSGVYTPAYEVGFDSCRYEFERLLELGTSNNRKLTAWVNEERKLIISEQPEKGTRDHYLDEQGRFYDPYGNRLLEGVVPVGEWVVGFQRTLHSPGGLVVPSGSKSAVFVKNIELEPKQNKIRINCAHS